MYVERLSYCFNVPFRYFWKTLASVAGSNENEPCLHEVCSGYIETGREPPLYDPGIAQ